MAPRASPRARASGPREQDGEGIATVSISLAEINALLGDHDTAERLVVDAVDRRVSQEIPRGP